MPISQKMGFTTSLPFPHYNRYVIYLTHVYNAINCILELY